MSSDYERCLAAQLDDKQKRLVQARYKSSRRWPVTSSITNHFNSMDNPIARVKINNMISTASRSVCPGQWVRLGKGANGCVNTQFCTTYIDKKNNRLLENLSKPK